MTAGFKSVDTKIGKLQTTLDLLFSLIFTNIGRAEDLIVKTACVSSTQGEARASLEGMRGRLTGALSSATAIHTDRGPVAEAAAGASEEWAWERAAISDACGGPADNEEENERRERSWTGFTCTLMS